MDAEGSGRDLSRTSISREGLKKSTKTSSGELVLPTSYEVVPSRMGNVMLSTGDCNCRYVQSGAEVT